MDDLNSRTNSFEEGGNDENQRRPIEDKGLKALEGLQGPMTRARAKRAKEALNQLVVYLNKEGLTLEGLGHEREEPKLVHVIQLEELED